MTPQELTDRIKFDTPQLFNYLRKLANSYTINISVKTYIDDSQYNYVVIDTTKPLPNNIKEQYNIDIYYYIEEAYEHICGENDKVISEFDYIKLLYEWEKENCKKL